MGIFDTGNSNFLRNTSIHGLSFDVVQMFYMRDIFVCRKLEFKNAIQLEKCITITYAKILKSDKLGPKKITRHAVFNTKFINQIVVIAITLQDL